MTHPRSHAGPGVSAINGQTGALSFTSAGGTVAITPFGAHGLNFETAGSGGDTITSPNSTLSVGGTSSATTLDLNLGHANVWSAFQTFGAGLESIGPVTLGAASGVGVNPLLINPNSVPNYSQVSFTPSTGTNVNQTLSVIPKGAGQTGDVAQMTVFGTDFIADPNNYEAIALRATGTAYNLTETAQGTGQIRPLIISASNNNTDNQLYLAPTSRIGMYTATPDSPLNLVATLPASGSGSIWGAHFSFTTQGSSASVNNIGMEIDLAAGYTGSAGTYGFGATNQCASTANSPWQIFAQKGDLGGFAFYDGDGISNAGVGLYGGAFHLNNTAGALYGVFGVSNNSADTAAVQKVGVAGIAKYGVINVGVYAGLIDAAPTLLTAAMIADVGSVSAPMILGRAGGSTLFSVDVAGNITKLNNVTTNFPSANAAGALTNDGSGNFSYKKTSSIVTQGDLTAQSAAVTSVMTAYNTPNDSTIHTYRVNAYTAITAISAGTLTVQLSFTDETNTVRTLSYFAMGLTSAGLTGTGFDAFPPAVIRCKANTAITVLTTFTGVSITYDVGAYAEFIY